MKLKELREGQYFNYEGQTYIVDKIYYCDEEVIGVANIKNYQHLLFDADTEVEEY